MSFPKEIDAGVPGGVYLCQVNEEVSCGACCGLYNVEIADRQTLAAMLADRTRMFSETPRKMDAILNFGEKMQGRESSLRPYPEFHHCPYIGMVGEKKSRVGCLLHPLADGNGGIDFRGLSYYGGMACRTYFCPACKSVNPVYMRVLRGVADDWHAYGLIVTEAVLVDSFFKALEICLGRAIEPADILGHDAREALIRRFIALRSDWPFRLRPEKLCNYFFEDRQYPKPPVDYDPAADGGLEGRSAHIYDIFFRELESRFASEEAVRAATRIFDDLFDEWVNLVDPPPGRDLRGG